MKLDGYLPVESRPSEPRRRLSYTGAINMLPERQEKLGVSGWVKVPVEKV